MPWRPCSCSARRSSATAPSSTSATPRCKAIPGCWTWPAPPRHGRLVLWEFGAQSGTSFAGELQPAPFYPPTWLLGLLRLDGIALCDAFVLLHFALAATTMHLLLRDAHLSRLAAVLGASLFAFCGYLPFQADA